MTFSATDPAWMWLCFAGAGCVALVLIALITLQGLRIRALARGAPRSAAEWNICGHVLLFAAVAVT